MHDELIAHAREQGIEFMSTAFDTGSLNLLASRGLTRFKVPSGEITNLPYLRHMATLAREVIISTGMATLPEIEDAIRVFQSAGIRRDSMTVLHCTTEYPAPMDEVNLRAMQTIADACGVSVGYSDHTIGIEVAVAAVAMGARVIEKHLTLDCNLPGPDHKASLEPEVFREMVLAIRNIEKALGSHVKAPSPSELRNKSVARRSLVASRPIHAGEKFTPDNVTSKRPGTGLSPMQWDEVMGRTATSDFQTDECISL
jgi:N,N'-diacetyllegionaminate synthase